jgi:hypothetical protein
MRREAQRPAGFGGAGVDASAAGSGKGRPGYKDK